MNSPRSAIDVNWALLLGLVTVATLVIAPSFFLGNISGHDFQFHIESWMEVAQQWHQGILYPRWAEWANFGFGEPRFIFYPPASWMLGAALSKILPWHMVPDAFIWLALVVAGFSMHRLAREWLAPRDAIAAAILFSVNPYNLMIVYYRSDFAELLAGAFFPLLVWCAIFLAREGWRRVPAFACVFALIWLTNAPAAVISTYFVAAIILVYCILERSLRALLPAIVAGATGFALAAFYILPAAYEQRWVNISEVLTFNLQPWHNFLFATAGDPEFILFNFKMSGIALFIIAMFGISAVFAARQRLARENDILDFVRARRASGDSNVSGRGDRLARPAGNEIRAIPVADSHSAGARGHVFLRGCRGAAAAQMARVACRISCICRARRLDDH